MATPTLATPHSKQELLHRAIATLSDAEKAVITLYLDDYRYVEIAQITGMLISHVRVKLNRINSMFKNFLSQTFAIMKFCSNRRLLPCSFLS